MSAAPLGLFGRGRLAGAIAEAAGDALRWQVAREAPPDVPVACAVEASAGAAVPGRVDWAVATGTPLVVASTGWELPDLARRVGERTGVLVAPNLSLAVALLARLARVLARFAAEDESRDPYLVEHHHARKRDAPGGTALLLADALLAGCPRKRRIAIPGARPLAPDELSVSVVRAGHTPSSHTVGVDAPGESLVLTHAARDLSPYARGALAAAGWIAGRRGVYTLDDWAAATLDPLFERGAPAVPPPREGC